MCSCTRQSIASAGILSEIGFSQLASIFPAGTSLLYALQGGLVAAKRGGFLYSILHIVSLLAVLLTCLASLHPAALQTAKQLLSCVPPATLRKFLLSLCV